MPLNPNFPVIDYGICWSAGPNQSVIQPFWCSLLERTDSTKGGPTTVTRGKQYALDQVQPGEMDLSLTNKDGALDPSNPASPYAGYVIPYRLIRMRAQWPPTQNLLTADQATGGKAEAGVGTGGALPADVASFGGAGVSLLNVSSTLNQYLIGYAASPPAFTGVGFTGWSVTPGGTYSVSGTCTASANNGLAMYFAIQWIAADGVTVLSTSNGTPAVVTTGLSTQTLTAAAPANAAGARLVWLNNNSPAAATSAGLRALQVEKASIASSYTQPGHWYSLFTGYVERWPQRWTDSGIYGVSDITAVDEMALFSQRNLLAPFKADLMALGPNFLYALDESSGTSTFADLTGNRGPSAISRPTAAGAVQAGDSVSSSVNSPVGYDSATALTGAFLGGAGPVLKTILVTDTSGHPSMSTSWLGIPPDAATGLVGVPQSGAFTRIIAVRATSMGGYVSTAWGATDPTGSYGLTLEALGTVAGTAVNYALECVAVSAAGSSTTPFNLPGYAVTSTATGTETVVYLDGAWHLLAVSMSADGKTVNTWADSNPTPTTTVSANSVRPPAGLSAAGYTDALGASIAGTLRASSWAGDLAFACELPFAISPAQWTALNQSWRNAWSSITGTPEASSQRYQRILNWLGYVGPTRISTGLCKSMGPATDIATAPTSPTQGLQALQNVVDTENGQHFVGADGAVVFQSRADRYNKTASIVFGEKTSLGEIPYLDAQFDYDPTRIANDVQVTAQYGNALYRQQDANSQNTFGAIQLQRTVNTTDSNEATAAAQALLAFNKAPQQRLKTLVVDPSANPSLWAACLGLELGTPCAVNRRPQGAPPITAPGFIEQINFSIDGSTNQATFAFQVSANNNRSFGQYGTKRYAPDAGSIKPAAAMTAGQTTVTLVTTGGTPITNAAGAFPADILIDNEQITLTAASGSTTSPQTFTIVRGVNGTTAATHPATSAIRVAASSQYAY